MAPLPPPPKMLHVDAILTAVPARVTPPGLSRRIATAAPLGSGLLQSYFRIVLYYAKAAAGEEEEDTVTLGAWIKESLSEILSKHPVMAGRLRRDGEGLGCWEIKLNDSGVRMVQSTAETSVAEFFAAEHRDRWEALLASPVEVDEEDPQFSPLFYIQVTQFQGGGYSVGVSCSLLLCDPLFLGQFLRAWTRHHRTMAAEGRLCNSPLFHLRCFRSSSRHLRSIELDCTDEDSPASAEATATVLFEIDSARSRGSSAASAVACLGEAARKLETKKVGAAASMLSRCTVVISEHSGGVEVVMHDVTGLEDSVGGKANGEAPREVSWVDLLGIEDMCFVDGRKPLYASCRVVSAVDGGLAVAMLPAPPHGKGMNVSALMAAI